MLEKTEELTTQRHWQLLDIQPTGRRQTKHKYSTDNWKEEEHEPHKKPGGETRCPHGAEATQLISSIRDGHHYTQTNTNNIK